MDLMALRRVLMTLTGGGTYMIGELSHYEKKTLTFPNATNGGTWADGAIVPCTFTPKLIVFYGGTRQNGNIISGVFCLTIGNENENVGGVNIVNTAGTGTQTVYFANSSAASQRFKFDTSDNKFYAARANASGTGVTWSSTDEYTFEIYG